MLRKIKYVYILIVMRKVKCCGYPEAADPPAMAMGHVAAGSGQPSSSKAASRHEERQIDGRTTRPCCRSPKVYLTCLR